MTKETLNNLMTSELLFHAILPDVNSNDKDMYLAEYNRRLKIMGLTDEQIEKFHEFDELAIKNECYIKSEVVLATMPFIVAGMNKDSILLEKCTFSELVLLTDDANSAYIRDHEWLSQETFSLVCEHAIDFGTCKAAYEVRNRMQAIGLTQEQENIFIKNECQILKKLRWQSSTDPAWT